jgi:hypothetical protein
MSEPTLDKRPLLEAVGAELAGHRPHEPFEAVHAATHAALNAAYGDPEALALLARLETSNPELAELIKLAADIAAKHPGFWTGLYAHEHHAAPLPSDHPWARSIAHAFGASDAPPLRHHHHHQYAAGYYGDRPSAYWDPFTASYFEPAWVVGAGHPPPPPGHAGPPSAATYRGAPPPPPPGAYGARAAPPPPGAYARPGAPYGGGYGAYGRGYGGAYGRGYGGTQVVDDSAIYGGDEDLGDFHDYAAHDDEDANDEVAPMPAAPPLAAPQAVPTAPIATPAPAAVPLPAIPMPTTTGADPWHHERHIRRVLRQAMEFFRTAPLPFGVTLAQRNMLLQQLFALALSPTAATAHAVMLQLQNVLAGPEAQAYALQIAALFPAWATGAAPRPPFDEQQLGRRQGVFHEHDPRWQQRELSLQEQERWAREHEGRGQYAGDAYEEQRREAELRAWEAEHGGGGGYVPPAPSGYVPPAPYGGGGYVPPAPGYGGHPAPPREGYGRHPAPPREGYGRHPAPPRQGYGGHPAPPRPGAPGVPGHYAVGPDGQGFVWVPASGAPTPGFSPLASVGPVHPSPPGAPLPHGPGQPGIGFSFGVSGRGGGRGHGGGGRGGWGGSWGYGWDPYLGPQYVIDERNELEDVPYDDQGERDPEGMGN